MIDPISLSENMMYGTLILYTEREQGTGFLYETPSKRIVVVSNRHLVEGTDKLDFSKSEIKQFIKTIIHIKGGNATVTGQVCWHLHPSVDLAFFSLDELLAPYEKTISLDQDYLFALSEKFIPTQKQLDELSACEDVTMVGYPSGRFDQANNYPLFRYGKTATHPAVDFNGGKMGLIDVPCLPGSSGSPVMILNEGSFHTKKGDVVIGSRLIFIGIEVSMPYRENKVVKDKKDPDTGNVLFDENGKKLIEETELYIQEDLSMGFYIKSTELLAFNRFFKSLGL